MPAFLYHWLADLRDRVRHEGKYDYKMKRDRTSSLDYTTRYDHKSIRKARKSILWDDDWREATRATVAIFQELDLLGANQTIVDYGGGIGRISRAVLENSGSRVIMVDRSAEMREHAINYVPKKLARDGRFTILSDEEFLEKTSDIRGRIDLILFIEALQHIPEPILEDLFPRMITTLAASGRIFVLGNKDLDIDCQAGRHQTLIGDFLQRHTAILRQDVWTEWERRGEKFRFKYPRYSFLCRPES